MPNKVGFIPSEAKQVLHDPLEGLETIMHKRIKILLVVDKLLECRKQFVGDHKGVPIQSGSLGGRAVPPIPSGPPRGAFR